MMCDARLFEVQVATFSVDRAVMVAPLTGQTSVEALAGEILAHAPPKFALAGLSMGGITAMEIIKRAPERVTRLALMDTNPHAEQAARALERVAQIERVRAGGLRPVMRDEMKPNYLSEGPNKGRILDLCMAMSEALGVEVFIDQSLALKHRPDQCDTLRAIQVPTLILCGEDDTLCPVEKHELMRDLIPNAHLVIVPGAGHLPVLEQPARTTDALRRWLSS